MSSFNPGFNPARKTIRTYGKRTHRVVQRAAEDVDAVFEEVAEKEKSRPVDDREEPAGRPKTRRSAISGTEVGKRAKHPVRTARKVVTSSSSSSSSSESSSSSDESFIRPRAATRKASPQKKASTPLMKPPSPGHLSVNIGCTADASFARSPRRTATATTSRTPTATETSFADKNPRSFLLVEGGLDISPIARMVGMQPDPSLLEVSKYSLTTGEETRCLESLSMELERFDGLGGLNIDDPGGDVEEGFDQAQNTEQCRRETPEISLAAEADVREKCDRLGTATAPPSPPAVPPNAINLKGGEEDKPPPPMAEPLPKSDGKRLARRPRRKNVLSLVGNHISIEADEAEMEEENNPAVSKDESVRNEMNSSADLTPSRANLGNVATALYSSHADANIGGSDKPCATFAACHVPDTHAKDGIEILGTESEPNVGEPADSSTNLSLLTNAPLDDKSSNSTSAMGLVEREFPAELAAKDGIYAQIIPDESGGSEDVGLKEVVDLTQKGLSTVSEAEDGADDQITPNASMQSEIEGWNEVRDLLGPAASSEAEDAMGEQVMPEESKIAEGEEGQELPMQPPEELLLPRPENIQTDWVMPLTTKSLIESAEATSEAKAVKPGGLQALLELAGQTSSISFDDFLERSHVHRKIGEATYSSVFSLTYRSHAMPAAVKIIPFREGAGMTAQEQDMMPVEDVVTEIRVTQRVGVIDGFVNCLGIGVIQGSWPKWLTDIWDSWTEDSENIHPSDLPAEQIYALIVLPDGGKDLEHSPPFTISQCKSIVQQLVAALATAEHLLRFEHRDLHWGNVLVRDITADEDMEHSAAIRDHEFKVPCHGIQVCIIDYTWGRVEGEDCIYTAMDDPSLFEGPGKGKRGGDLQFDVYRWMKDEVNDEWGQFFPKTNIFWVHYVLDKLLTRKQQPLPRTGPKEVRQKVMRERKRLEALRDRVLEYSSCLEAVECEMLGGRDVALGDRWLALDSGVGDDVVEGLRTLAI